MGSGEGGARRGGREDVGSYAAATSGCGGVAAVSRLQVPGHDEADVSQAVALAALRHREELLGKVDDLRRERDECVAWLRGRRLQVADSDANFALFGRFADRHAVWQRLLDEGVLVREVGPEGSMHRSYTLARLL